MSCFRTNCPFRSPCTSTDTMRCESEDTCQYKVVADVTIVQTADSVKMVSVSLTSYRTPTKTN